MSLQKSSGLYTLHARPGQVKSMFEGVAAAYKFESVEQDKAIYRVNVRAVHPDGGACENINSSVVSGLSYSMSVLTLGVVPATFTHCFVVEVSLFEKIDGEWLEIGDFISNQGRVDVYGGLNDVDNYRLTVTVRDEARALETSMAALLADMIKQGAFE